MPTTGLVSSRLSSSSHSHPKADGSWRDWKNIDQSNAECKGYDLYHLDKASLTGPTSGRAEPPALDSFGLFGDRGYGFECSMVTVSVVFAARDRFNRDVVIKLISKGHENAHELEILQLLNSEPLKFNPLNATVPVVEFLQFQDWNFVVMPYCDQSFKPPMTNAEESLEFAEQILTGLAFLHKNRIAHLDVSHENILINHHGKVPQTCFWLYSGQWVKSCPPPEFRSTFPVRYLFTDFGYSCRFSPSLSLEGCWMDPMHNGHGRRHKAPEVNYARFNPFAADVYQTARLFYSWFYHVTPNIPGFFEFLQDMTSFYPPDRPSAAVALERLRHLRSQVPKEIRSKFVNGLEPGFAWPIVKRPFLRTLREIYMARGATSAAQFVFKLSKM
ncbi:kinase-like domain-containing protein [Amylostereum chailletii]|nr:kinase-like domain-containing protein [Amylostereum chailletii]